MIEKKPMIVKKSVKHTFSAEETAALNVEFRQAYANAEAVEADAASIRSQLKAKIDEAAGRMKTLNATLQAGFEYRDKECVVVFRPPDKKKDFILPEDFEQFGEDAAPVLTEAMTAADFEQELISADALFDGRSEISLWSAGPDSGRLVVGSHEGKWFAAARGNVGQQKIEERLDSEQPASKKRFDAIQRAAKRLNEWLRGTLGKEVAKGFEDRIFKAVEAEREKAE